MKNMSIRNKVSMWYTFAMLAITICSIFTLVMLGNTMIQARQKTELSNYMLDIAENMTVENGLISFNSRYVTNDGQVLVMLYDADRELLRGFAPLEFPQNIEIPLNSIEKVKNEETGESWFVYELSVPIDKDIYFIRGITSINMLINNEHVYTSLSTALVVLPLIILIAILGGNIITDSAFSHFAKLSDMANNIQDGKDLSRRIEVTNNDEFGMLSISFNSLFDRLQKSFEREKQFTDDASHELRTPITVILSECEYAFDLDNAEEMRDSICVIHKQAKKMSTLVNQLLMLSRSGDLSKVINKDIFNFSELVEVICEELEIQAAEKNIKLITGIDKNIYANGDQSTLTRMIINLVTNAIKYGNNGGWIKISITHRGNDIIGIISDNGIGIAKEHISKIFDRFYRVNPARTESGSSTGLGLSMVKWIAEVHGGEISVDSTLGEGTTFKFTLPIYIENKEN